MNNDKPAFPHPHYSRPNTFWPGMTAREMFAGLAMAELCGVWCDPCECAQTSVAYADALLDELARETTKDKASEQQTAPEES